MKRTLSAAIAIAALLSAWLPAPAGAADPPLFTVVATNLDAPRGMDIGADGALYISETGKGGDLCNADKSFCGGFTGALTRVGTDGTQARVITGLPSFVAQGPEGPFLNGPTDVAVGGGRGYHMAAADGGVFTFGDALFLGSAGSLKLNSPVVDIADIPSSLGYWLFAADGGVFNYGLAPFLGSAGNIKLNAPVVGGFGMPSGAGYALVASDGGVFNYGDSKFFGSTGSIKLNKPVVAAFATPSGLGYYLVASDGGVFTFGDATFRGSMGGAKLNAPIVGGVATPSGKGYHLVAADGGVFSFGDAAFHGSMGGTKLNQPVVGGSISPTGDGYWLIASDGGVFTFGDAGFYGSTGSIKLNQPMVGATATPVAKALTIGLGANPDSRSGDFGKLLATLVFGTGGTSWMPVADLGAFEKASNPDAPDDVDTNPYAVAFDRGVAHVADAGANDVVEVGLLGNATGTVLPRTDLGGGNTADAVPTSIVRGPDGAWYIGQLTGAPFAAGAAKVWRWSGVPGAAPTVYREGFTTIADIGFAPNGNLYVSELRFTSGGSAGQVVEVTPSNVRRVVIKGLTMPTGLVVRSNTQVYVTNCGQFCPAGAGHVISFDPTKAPDGGIVVPPPAA